MAVSETGRVSSARPKRARRKRPTELTWQISTLENGLRVVTTPVPTAQSVSVNIFVGVGSRGEDRRRSGLSHYMEHMLFKGTTKRPSAIAVAETIEGAGGVLNAYTSKELTCYWNQVPFDRLELAMDVLSDLITDPLLDGDEINRERSVVQQEIRRAHDVPAAWAGELLSRAAYGDQPIGWAVTGTEESVGELQRQDFLDHKSTWYVPGNMVLSVAGNTEHDRVMELAQTYLGAVKASGSPAFEAARPGLPEEHVLVENRHIAQCNLGFGLRALSRTDPDRYILLILNTVLGRGMSSRLFKEVRERRGLAYAVGSGITRHNDTGLLTISAGVSPEKVSEATTVILQEVFRLVEEPVGEQELTKARDYTVGSYRLSLETAMALAQRAGENLLTVGEIERIEDVVTKLEAVSAADIQRVAVRLLRRDNLAMAMVGPGASQEELAELLA
jgi:predicted Zn-dependent peptidase